MSFCSRAVAVPWCCSLESKILTYRWTPLFARRHRRTAACLAAVFIALALAAAAVPRAGAQPAAQKSPAGAARPATAASAPAAPTPPQAATAPKSANCAIYGTVLDSNGGVISGAKVALSGSASRNVVTDARGNFSFTRLPAGSFSVKATGSGMSPAQVANIVLIRGAVRFLPPVVLQVAAASTSVRVFANPEALAEQQVQLELHQRVLGVMPDYYTSYDWNAVHMYPKQKFELGYHAEFDWVTFGIIGAEAGVEQYYNRFPEYGRGMQGYAKRYGAAYATHFAGTMIAAVALPVLFHQDPRYFFKGTGSFTSRALYAVSRSVICRGDNGHPEFSYSHVLGDIAAGGISNLYYPASDRGVGLTFSNAAINLAANASTNLIREFILPGLISHGPAGVKDKGIIHF